MKLNLPKWLVLSSWGIKLLAAFAFYWVYSSHYGEGELTQDAGAYIGEAERLNSIRADSFDDYSILIFNRNGTDHLIHKYFHSIDNSRFSRNDDPLGETRNHIRALSFLLTLTLGNKTGLWLALLFLNLISLFYLFKKLNEKSDVSNLTFFLFLTPSLIFWTSSPLKESLTLSGLALVFSFALSAQKKWTNWLLLALGCVLILITKSYLLGLIGVSFAGSLLFYSLKARKYSIIALVVGFFIISVFAGFPTKLLNTINNKQLDFKNIIKGGIHLKNDTTYFYLPYKKRTILKPIDSTNQIVLIEPTSADVIPFSVKKATGKSKLNAFIDTLELTYCEKESASSFEIMNIDSAWDKLFFSAPFAIINTFFRPFLNFKEINFRDVLLFIENIFFVLLLYFGIWKTLKNNAMTQYLVFGLLLFIVFTSLLIGWITPVSGAIVRYKIPIYLAIITVYLLTLKTKSVND
ncbi:MAG: hypothetical protein KJ941_08920 [Bacteroidetes bacterium]|nr:hypothetical protein [Bacteroidota bacterium]